MVASRSSSATPRSASQPESSATLRSRRPSARSASSSGSSGTSCPCRTELGGLALGLLLRGLLGRLRRLGLLGIGDGLDRDRAGALQPQPLEDQPLELGGQLRVLGDVLLRVVAPQPQVAVREEGPRLLDQVLLEREVEQATLLGHPDAVLDVELGLAEGGGDLVLDHLDPAAVAHRLGALLEGLDAADVESLRGVEL